MNWHISYASDLKKTAIFVSKYDHGLLDLLWQWRRGELPAQVTMVISNHATLRAPVEELGVPFHEVPVAKDDKASAEQRMLELLDGQAELIVLARYMQILSPDFVARYPHAIINIHHSFLPAFVGANPYRQAYDRGVKLIGATAHYATAELDAGPIIDQAVLRVSHRHSVKELKRLGRDIERQVLARAVKWHLEDRIIVHSNKTMVFV
jgi:formyltetrahydrofolate deformylase